MEESSAEDTIPAEDAQETEPVISEPNETAPASATEPVPETEPEPSSEVVPFAETVSESSVDAIELDVVQTLTIASGEEIITTPTHPFYSPVKGWTEAAKLRAGDILVLVNGEYVVVEKVQHEFLEAPVTVYNFQVDNYHTYFVSNIGVLVHNKCTRNTTVSSREEALEYGRKFLGEGYTKEGQGRYVSADRFRQMRFDFTHHDGTTHHINLETFRYPIAKGTRNKVIIDEHVFW